MADVGQELGLRPIRRFGLISGQRQLELELLAFGDVPHDVDESGQAAGIVEDGRSGRRQPFVQRRLEQL